MSNKMKYSKSKILRRLAKQIKIEDRGKIGQEEYKSNLKPKKGPRAIFLEKYNVTRDIKSAKKELDENGYNSSRYTEKVFHSWINEDRDK